MPRIRIPEPDYVDFLVKRKYPELQEPLSPLQRKYGDANGIVYDQVEEPEPVSDKIKIAARAYRAELSSWKKSDLKKTYRVEIEKQHAENDGKRFFNQPDAEADFDYWAKMTKWSQEEAIVLSFGKDRPSIHTKNVVPYRYASWAKRNEISFPEKLYTKVAKFYRINQLDQKHDKLQNRQVSGVSNNNGYTPLYLKLMLKAVKDLGLSPDQRMDLETIKSWFHKNWPADLEGKSDRLIDYMATLVRRPQDKKGGNSPWNKK